MVVTACWALAVIAGFLWSRWWTGLFTLATVVIALIVEPRSITTWTGWARLVALAATPWLPAMFQDRHERLLTSLQAEEASVMMGISEATRQLLIRQQATQGMERQIADITEVYRVTKEASRSLHVHELFSAAIAVAPRLLKAQTLRLVDCSGEPPKALRATRAPSGEFIAGDNSALNDLETAIITQAMASPPPVGSPKASQWIDRARDRPFGPTTGGGVAWAPLWREQQPIGVLIAEGLPEAQVKTLSMVADQLSLQLSRIHLYQQVESLAVTDALTGLWVRRHVLQRAAEEFARARRHGGACAVVMADLDQFKEKNDTYGHLVGDAVLKEVAGLLSRNLREVDLIGRYGGEEFILLLVETTGEQALPVAERLRQLVEVHPIQAYDEQVTQTISLGIAAFPDDATTMEGLIERADQALYAAKRAGRNRVVRWKKISPSTQQ